MSPDGLPHQAWRVLRTGGVYVLISSLESTELALGPPAWRQGEWHVSKSRVETASLSMHVLITAPSHLPTGEWHVSKSRVETGMGRRCFVFRAMKRQGTTDAPLSEPYLESDLGHAPCWLRGRQLRTAADVAVDETLRAAADAADEPSKEQSNVKCN